MVEHEDFWLILRILNWVSSTDLILSWSEMISKAVTPDTIDLPTQLLTLSVGRAARFLDSSHLSRQGHVFAAGIIEARVRSDASTL